MGAKSPRPLGSGKLVASGIKVYERALRDVLGRWPAQTSADELRFSWLQRRLTVAVLRLAARQLCEDARVLGQLRLFDDAFCAVESPRTAAAAGWDAVAAVDWDGAAAVDWDGAAAVNSALADAGCIDGAGEPEELGELLESLLSLVAEERKGKLRFLPSKNRKQSGMFYTPRAVVRSVARHAIAPWVDATRPWPRICDPSMGGGAFLLGAARALVEVRGAATEDAAVFGAATEGAAVFGAATEGTTVFGAATEGTTVFGAATEGAAVFGAERVGTRARRRAVEEADARREVALRLHGFDIEPLAIAVTEAALAIWGRLDGAEVRRLRGQLRLADALSSETASEFELVIGNPPWVAFAGRATQPLPDERRQWLATHYQAFRGYPTLHACFVELGARLAPRGRVALLVPSPIADLDGYRPMRRVLTRTHRIHSDLFEYGQDAFEGVVQPCFALVADADPAARESEAPFALVERSGAGGAASRVEPPECLARLAGARRFPPECFREFGFQTTRTVSETMLRRGSPEAPFDYPLLEGREVSEFRVGDARLFLRADRDRLKQLQCRLRDAEEFKRVEFLIRQTAKYTIAALHNGLPFRNSLLAGFGCAEFPAVVLVGLLNSTLIRALHLAAQRDARQKTFPQVKVAHLRALPAPPTDPRFSEELSVLVRSLNGQKPDQSHRDALDRLAYAWYGITADEAVGIERFYAARAR